jgi:ABC-type Na+ efflux pump permease subunit
MRIAGINPITGINNIGNVIYNITQSIKNFRRTEDFVLIVSFILLILVILYLVGVWAIVFYFKWV